VIIDDICDGGATFFGDSRTNKAKTFTLIVTHGIFSKGFAVLEKKFDKIIVSDSYRKSYDSRIVKMISANIID
jgi:ribose-phosphate pyrophosphokinase